MEEDRKFCGKFLGNYTMWKNILGKNTHLSLDEGEDRQLWGKLQYEGVYKFHPFVNIELKQKFNEMWELI